MEIKNVSPLRYPGGKTRACKVLHEILANHYDMNLFDTLVSPFFGGGSFEFYLQNTYGMRLIVNDKFQPLYQFWKQVQTNKNLLCDELRKIPLVTKEEFTEYRKTILTTTNTLQQAIYYFIINRCSFSGATLSGGFSKEAAAKRFTPSSIDRIQALRLDNLEMYNMDFTDFILKMFASETALLFLDPPYYLEKSKSNLYGNNGDMHEQFNHIELFDLLKTKKNWILTYNDCPFIRNLYIDYTIVETQWSYGMNKTKESSEIVILPPNTNITTNTMVKR
jgi:DNA adenine methylase